MVNRELSLKLDRARWWLLREQPFYGQLAMGLGDGIGCPSGNTACTDGKRIYWHPDFLGKLTEEETRFVLMHETLHCAHGHLWRLPPAEAEAQEAADHAINLTLSNIAGGKMPAGGLCDRKWEGKAEEEIFAALKREKKPGAGQPGQPSPGNGAGQGDGSGQIPDPGNSGSFGPPAPDKIPAPGKPGKPGQAPGPGQSLQEDWQQRVIAAAQAGHAAGRGDIPGDLQAILDRVAAVQVDWRREMSEFVRSAIGQRNDWSRSNRRMATAPVIYPRKQRSDLGLVVFVRDTSGSITPAVCAEFTALISSCTGEMNCSAIMLDCDAAVRAEHRLAAGELAPVEMVGGGGTDFRPAFDRAAELAEGGEQVAGLVYLSDLDGCQPDSIPEFPVLWLATEPGEAPFGRTVRVL